jgi:hypothetical protein
MRHYSKRFNLGLGDQHTVEWVKVMTRQPAKSFSMLDGRSQLRKLACIDSLPDSAFEPQFAQRQLDNDLPRAHNTDEYFLRSHNRVPRGRAQLTIPGPPA